MDPEGLISEVLECAFRVHRNLGPGLLESMYEDCLAHELTKADLGFRKQVACPVVYEGIHLGTGFRLDFLIEQVLVIELKSVERFMPLHTAQVKTYLKLMDCPVGLLLNFNVRLLRDGIRRVLR